MSISVVDIFAGPGGLGEGFSGYSPQRSSRQRPFRIAISAEMEPNAAKTLRLRAFFRQFPPGHAPASYYDYVAGRRSEPWTSRTEAQWKAACAYHDSLGQHEDVVPMWTWYALRRFFPATEEDKHAGFQP